MPLRQLLPYTPHVDKTRAGTHPMDEPCGPYTAQRFFAVWDYGGLSFVSACLANPDPILLCSFLTASPRMAPLAPIELTSGWPVLIPVPIAVGPGLTPLYSRQLIVLMPEDSSLVDRSPRPVEQQTAPLMCRSRDQIRDLALAPQEGIRQHLVLTLPMIWAIGLGTPFSSSQSGGLTPLHSFSPGPLSRLSSSTLMAMALVTPQFLLTLRIPGTPLSLPTELPCALKTTQTAA